MNFDEFNDTYFEGNADAAFAQLAKESYNHNYTYTKTHKNLKIILDSMSSETASKYMKFMGREIEKNPEFFSKTIDMGMMCAALRMDSDEIEKMDENPFYKKLLFDIIVGPSEILVFFVIALILEQFGLINYVTMAIISCLIFHGIFLICKSIIDLRNMLYFRKVKKFTEELEEKRNKGSNE